MDQVRLNAGSISGLKASQNAQEIHVFRGIPYAAPQGNLRRLASG